ncbi:uncharacterized protein LOC129179194 isoform X1 [Dunckerocampus dactyliophorus]|uniref:uncharacterized protein LOC129179194 isoform X1 n=1 Tax=Dunckerocampus dactyliophorus TaxID=161453 RepID=UPI00240772BF|nr:uncharacterized protein LOC129179194 isoform X1 [Dunckerocampus dactyliophorus]
MLKKLVKERLMAAAEEILSMFDRRIASYEGELARTRVEELVKERLMAAAGEILAMFDRRIASYEEELARMREEKERHRQQLEAVSKTGTVPQLKDVEQLGPQLQGGGATLKQDDPQTPHAKEEEEELWTTPEGDCLLGPEEADLTKFPLAGVSVKTEDHEDTPPESLQLHHSPHVQQLIGHQVERALQPQEGSSALKQEEQESLLHVKVEEEEAWTARDGACFLGPEEADLTQLPLTGVPVWTEYYEDTPRLLPEAEHGDYTQETLSDDIDCEGDKRSRSDSKHTECSKKKTTEEKGRLASCAMAEQRPKKRTQKSQRFLDRYGERWPCLVVSRLPYHAFCTVCKTDIDISHQGATDCRRHVEGAKHKKFERALPFVPKITPTFSADPDLRTIRAETLFTNFIAEHNLPVAVADHAGPLFKKMFPDSQIAQHYGCARTKTTAILNTISSNDEQVITDLMCCFPFSIATDGSASDMDGVKLHPLVVRVYDPSVGKIAVVLLKVVECRDSTSEGIYNLMDQELNKRKIPWGNCVSFAADNASVMQGARRGVAAFIKSRNPHIYIVGCACHLMHTAAEKSSSSLSIDIEDMLIVIYYYLDKSSKRKALVRELQMLCDTDVRKILKLSSTKWLALGKCVQRLLQQWEPLTRFFAEEAAGKEEAKPLASSAHLSLKNAAAWKPSTLTSTSGKSSKFCLRKSKMGPSSTQRQAAPGALPKGVDHFMCLQKQMGENQKDLSEKAETTAVRKPQRVYAFLTDPQAKLYALFLKRAVPLFETANQILQKEEPCVHTLLQTLELQLQKLLLAFCKPECVVEMMEEVKGGHQPTLYQSSEHQLPDEELCIGHDTQIFIKSQGVQQLIDIKEEHPRQPQGGISTLKQEDPQPPNLKEEKEELWITQEADHLRGPEEADLLKLPLTGVSGKTEEHEDKPPESSQLHHSPCEENRGAEPPSSSSQHMTEADGDHRGGSQADELLAPLSGSDDTTPRSPEDEDTDDTREALSSDTDREEGSAHVVQGGQRAASDFLSDVDNSASPSCPEQFSFETSGNRLVVEKKVPLSRWVGRPLGGGRIPSPPILKGKMRNSASLMRVFKGGRRLISASCR